MSWIIILFLLFLGLFSLFCLFLGFIVLRRMRGSHIQRRSVDEHLAWLEPHFDLHLPQDKTGPFPLVILLHGCGGARQSMTTYAQLFADAGYAALIIDSLAPRKIGYEAALAQVCSGIKLWGRERVADMLAGLHWARQHEDIDETRMALMGWSHGSWAILDGLCMQSAGLTPDGLDAWPASGFVGVKAIYALYPYCGFPALSRRYAWPESPPIESVLIKNDSVTNETASEAVYHRQVKNGANIQWHMIEGVTHGFDEPDHHPASVLKYDAKETHKMEVKLLNFLKRHLG